MTVQDIIKQTKTFTPEEKQELLYLLFISTISEDKRKNFTNLLHYEDDSEIPQFNKLSNSGAEDFGEIDMKNLKNDIYSHI